MIGGDASAAASDDSAQPVVAEELRQPAEPGQELARELAAIQSVILRNMSELSALIQDGNDPRMARAAGELGASVESWKRQHRRFSPRLSTTAHVLSPLY